MFEILPYILAGCILGIISGLLPGVHINLVSVLLVTYVPNADIKIAACIIAMSIVHSFVDFIPSICFGVPKEENFLSSLPGHRYFLKGKAYVAVMLTATGGLLGIIAGVFFLPLFFNIGTEFFYGIRNFLAYVLIGTILLMVFTENGIKKLWAILIVLLSGSLGVLILGNASSGNVIFAAVTGLFGISTLIESIFTNSQTKKQKISEFFCNRFAVAKSSILSIIGGSIVALIPGLGSNQAAFLIRQAYGKIRTSDYLVMIGGINTVNMMFSFFALYSIGKGRSGPAIAIQNLIHLNQDQIWLIIATALIAASIGFFATSIISKKLINKLNELNYKKINLAILGFVVLISILICNIYELIIILTAACIGILTIKTKVKRSLCMAFLIMPIAIYYFTLL